MQTIKYRIVDLIIYKSTNYRWGSEYYRLSKGVMDYDFFVKKKASEEFTSRAFFLSNRNLYFKYIL